MRLFKSQIAFLLGGALVVAGLQSAAFAGQVRTAALSGRQAPGTFTTFGNFDPPTLNASGQTAFWAVLAGPGIDERNNAGIWSNGSGDLELVARTGEQAPGIPSDGRYRRFLDRSSAATPVLNVAGQIAFHALLSGSGVDVTNNIGIWSYGPDDGRLVARRGNQAPHTPSGVHFSSTSFNSPPMLNEAGKMAFLGHLAGTGVDNTNRAGIWLEQAGNFELLARSGNQAPGTPSGVNYQEFHQLALNPIGEVAVKASLTGSGVDNTNDVGIWSGAPGALRLVVRGGEVALGTPSGVNYETFDGVTLNRTGRTAFRAELAGSGIDITNNVGLWSEGSGTLSLVAREGDQAPGTPEGVYFRHRFDGESAFEPPFSWPVLNAAGRIAFSGSLSGPGVDGTNDQAIWLEGSGGLELIARTGSRAPGTPEGVHFRHLSSPSINAGGQIAFYAGLTGTGIDFGNDDGIWATDARGVLRLVVRSGDAVEVAPSDFRIVSGIRSSGEISGNQDGRPSWFNDRGQIGFLAIFTDGSVGVFVSDSVAVPEPAMSTLVGMALFGAANSRCRMRKRSGQK